MICGYCDWVDDSLLILFGDFLELVMNLVKVEIDVVKVWILCMLKDVGIGLVWFFVVLFFLFWVVLVILVFVIVGFLLWWFVWFLVIVVFGILIVVVLLFVLFGIFKFCKVFKC